MVQACANVARSSVPLATPQQYLAFGAAGALLKYMQEACGLALVAKSLDVVPIVTPYHVHIDAASIEALELVQPAAVGGTRAAAGTSLFK